MVTLNKLKRFNTGLVYDIIYRTFLGAVLAVFFSSVINDPLIEQMRFFLIVAILTVVLERVPKLSFRTQTAKVENDVLTLLGVEFNRSNIEAIKYQHTSKFSHTLRIKQKGFLSQDFELNSPDFIANLRLLTFIKENFAPVTIVEELID